MDIEELAKKVAEYANTCCYRSDGFEEDVLKAVREAIDAAVTAEREACAKVCEDFDFNTREEIEPPKTLPKYCASAIRMRSNV